MYQKNTVKNLIIICDLHSRVVVTIHLDIPFCQYFLFTFLFNVFGSCPTPRQNSFIYICTSAVQTKFAKMHNNKYP